MRTFNPIKLLSLFSLLLGLSLGNTLLAQDQYKLAAKPELKVKGTSTLHDWEMTSAQAQGTAEMVLEGATLKNVKAASVTMKTQSIKSGTAKMDDLAYESLKASKFPDITFTLTSFRALDNNRGLATGNLTIAGTTKPVTFNVETSTKSNLVQMAGEANIKFTDFGIKPPTALLGTVKTGNELKINFKVGFQPVASYTKN
ncbi:polyisoprenoid-binding protein YceI [Pontibacter mucosus]|uniref:Polyisoprenoid-binding protein YceI n=1 Tax=Pontibacter mucosus TaxID=1649266 RepID=A0A2T5YDP4_9BACT|nr:YceI family protein [Pontibacter mucosus]PTX14666.1 polyisoprenoid-binding protein YceI [Pontibacter mucosus]